MQEDRSVIIREGRQAVRQAYGLPELIGTSTIAGITDSKAQPGGGNSWKRAATRVHATESRRTGSSRPVLPDIQRLTGFIHRCISELNPMEQNWVQYCYKPPGIAQSECGHKFMRTYSEQYFVLYLGGSRAGTRALIREMIAFRMAQEVGIIPRSARFESQNATISRQLWSKTLRDHWERICQDLSRVDGAALYKVGVKLNLYAGIC